MALPDTAELAKGYTQLNKTQQDAGSYLVSLLNIVPGQHVLDVGCGTGDITTGMARTVGPTGRVDGIDPSPERIALARQLAASSLRHLSFHEACAEDLSMFDDASFDILLVNSTLHWVQDQPRAIREFARVLRPGGRLGISGQSGDFVAAHETIKDAVIFSREPYSRYGENGKSGDPRFLKRAELAALLEAAGFAPSPDFSINTIVKSARDGHEMVDWLASSSSGKTYGGIPLDLRPAAREEMAAEWNKLAKADGTVDMPLDLLVTVATK